MGEGLEVFSGEFFDDPLKACIYYMNRNYDLNKEIEKMQKVIDSQAKK